jgi:hypothetical protein
MQGSYHFEGEAAGVNFGARVGVSKVTSGLLASTVSTSPTHFGVFAGFDKPVGRMFAIGGEASYLVIGSSSSGAVNVESFNLFSFLASAKLLF